MNTTLEERKNKALELMKKLDIYKHTSKVSRKTTKYAS